MNGGSPCWRWTSFEEGFFTISSKQSRVLCALRDLCERPVSPGTSCILTAHVATPCRSFSPLNAWR